MSTKVHLSGASVAALMLALAAPVFASPAYGQAPARPVSPARDAQAQPTETPGGTAGAGGDGAVSVGELVVTSRKREETILQVPATVSAFTGDQLRELVGGALSLNDIGYLTPGVSFVNTGNINSEINIRGAGAGTARTAGVDSPIAVLRDGASITGGNIGGRTYTLTDLFDIERIEVTRGPAGALYGVNAVGGVTNAISTRPRKEWGFQTEFGYSDDTEAYELTGIVNIPVGPDLALRVGLERIQRQGGFFYNTFSGKYGDRQDYLGGLWRPGEHVSIYSVLDLSHDTTPSNRIRTIYKINDATGLTAAQLPPADVDGPFSYSNNTSNDANRTLRNWSTQVAIDLPFGKLTSTSLIRTRRTNFLQDEDGAAPGSLQTPFPAPTCATRNCQTQFTDDTELASEEVRLQGGIGSRIDWLVGTNVNSRQTDFVTTSLGRTTSATNLAPSVAANTASVAKEEELQWGVFGDLTWRVTDRLTLDGALRYNSSDKKNDAFTVPISRLGVACPYGSALRDVNPSTSACVAARSLLEASFDNVAPSASLKYAFTPRFNIYGTYAQGYRAGGFNANSVLDPKIASFFTPESTDAYEVGLKLQRWGARFTASGFYNKFDDLLVTVASIGADNVSRNYRFNAGAAETHGVDLEAQGRAALPPGWGTLDYTAAYNWLDGEIKSGPFSGRTVEGSPEDIYTLTAIWRHPLPMGWGLVASGTYRGQRGGFFATTTIDNLVKNADVDLVGGKIGVEKGGLRVEVQADNLTDEVYETLRDPQRSVYADRRTVFFRVSYAFGSERR